MKLAIDAGHGLGNTHKGVFDSGATSNGHTEAAITMSWGATLKWVCSNRHVECFLTRDGSNEAPVGKRAKAAEKAGCTHYIAIHCNSGRASATGVETFYRDSQDKAFAHIVHDCMLKAMGTKDRGVKSESQSQHPRLAVLNFGPPACLVEIGFITNPKDLEKMLDRDVRIKFASLLMDRLNKKESNQ